MAAAASSYPGATHAPPVRKGVAAAVGNTPLLELPRLSELTGCTILGKAEFMNVGGSVKDRAALFIIEQAEAEGKLRPGDTIVEGTAGNTGIALTILGKAKGYQCVCAVASNQAQEKLDALTSLGAKLILADPVPFANEGNYFHVARRYAEENEGCFFANQFENVANSQAHYCTTGPEIWAQTGGNVDAIVMAAGTGGTIAGTSLYLKEQKPDLVVALIDPPGSMLRNYVATGEVTPAEGSSITEGIGIGRLTANFARGQVDMAFPGTDAECIHMAHFLLQEEGLFVGGSAALNVVGAVKLSRHLPKGSTIVTILCDGGARYQSKIFNQTWLEEHEFTPDPSRWGTGKAQLDFVGTEEPSHSNRTTHGSQE